MPQTYTPIASNTLSTSAATVTFSSIPSTYTDLVVVMNSATTHTSATFISMLFNSDNGTNYSVCELYGTGSNAYSTRSNDTNVAWLGLDVSISSTLGDSIITADIMNYANTLIYKSWLGKVNRASSSLDYPGANLVTGTWRNSSAINSITIQNTRGASSYNFASGSVFTLYGIKAA